jgi:hypothetical protein
LWTFGFVCDHGQGIDFPLLNPPVLKWFEFGFIDLRSGACDTNEKVKMDKNFFGGGSIPVLPVVLGIVLAGPTGLALVRSLGLPVTELPMLVAGSICGALVVVVSWLCMVLVNKFAANK